MTLDVLGLLAACSYALDCVEAELVHVTNNHSKRVAYMSVCIAKQMGIQEESLQDLAVCALLHDNALTQYIQEELHNDISQIAVTQEVPKLGAHCIWGEKNVAELPFHTDVSDVILYHHENADGSGPFGKKWDEIPLFSRIIHLCDLLDIACRTKKFAEGTWKVAEQFVQNSTGTMFDRECRDAFLRAFSEEQFLSLDRETFEDQLWKMVPRIKQDLDFSQIRSINLDEYKGLPADNDQSYAYFMRHNLFDHVNIKSVNTFIPNGMEADVEKECSRYNAIIRSMGGIDLQLLGIGNNGHIGFNEPSDSFAKETHCVDLTENTIQANARFFSFIEEVPTQAYTTGIKNIMQARHILLIASGEAKADALYEAVYGPITPHVPASILQLHDEVSVVADEAALSRIIKEGLI